VVTVQIQSPCPASLHVHILTDTYKTSNFTGLLCVDAKGIGTYGVRRRDGDCCEGAVSSPSSARSAPAHPWLLHPGARVRNHGYSQLVFIGFTAGQCERR